MQWGQFTLFEMAIIYKQYSHTVHQTFTQFTDYEKSYYECRTLISHFNLMKKK